MADDAETSASAATPRVSPVGASRRSRLARPRLSTASNATAATAWSVVSGGQVGFAEITSPHGGGAGAAHAVVPPVPDISRTPPPAARDGKAPRIVSILSPQGLGPDFLHSPAHSSGASSGPLLSPSPQGVRRRMEVGGDGGVLPHAQAVAPRNSISLGDIAPPVAPGLRGREWRMSVCDAGSVSPRSRGGGGHEWRRSRCTTLDMQSFDAHSYIGSEESNAVSWGHMLSPFSNAAASPRMGHATQYLQRSSLQRRWSRDAPQSRRASVLDGGGGADLQALNLGARHRRMTRASRMSRAVSARSRDSVLGAGGSVARRDGKHLCAGNVNDLLRSSPQAGGYVAKRRGMAVGIGLSPCHSPKPTAGSSSGSPRGRPAHDPHAAGEGDDSEADELCVGGLVGVSNFKDRESSTSRGGMRGVLNVPGAVSATQSSGRPSHISPSFDGVNNDVGVDDLDDVNADAYADREVFAKQYEWVWDLLMIVVAYLFVVEASYSAGAAVPFMAETPTQIYAALVPAHAVLSAMLVYDVMRLAERMTLHWAAFELLPALPLSMVCYLVSALCGGVDALDIMGQVLGLLRFVALRRVPIFLTDSSRFQDLASLSRRYVTVRYGLADTATQLFSFLLACHVCAACWMKIRRHTAPDAGDGGYFRALYFMVVTLTSVGYGDVSAETDLEKIYCIVMFLFSLWINGLVIGNMTVALARANVQMRHAHQLLLTEGVATGAGVSDFLLQQMLLSKSLHLDCQFDEVFPDMAQRCPEVLQRHFEMWARLPLLREMTVLRDLPDLACAEIGMLADELCIYPGCPLVIRGQPIAHVYLLSSGVCIRKNADDEQTFLLPGSGFGSEQGVGVDAVESVTSLTTCEFFVIKGSDFQAIKTKFGFDVNIDALSSADASPRTTKPHESPQSPRMDSAAAIVAEQSETSVVQPLSPVSRPSRMPSMYAQRGSLAPSAAAKSVGPGPGTGRLMQSTSFVAFDSLVDGTPKTMAAQPALSRAPSLFRVGSQFALGRLARNRSFVGFGESMASLNWSGQRDSIKYAESVGSASPRNMGGARVRARFVSTATSQTAGITDAGGGTCGSSGGAGGLWASGQSAPPSPHRRRSTGGVGDDPDAGGGDASAATSPPRPRAAVMRFFTDAALVLVKGSKKLSRVVKDAPVPPPPPPPLPSSFRRHSSKRSKVSLRPSPLQSVTEAYQQDIERFRLPSFSVRSVKSMRSMSSTGSAAGVPASMPSFRNMVRGRNSNADSCSFDGSFRSQRSTAAAAGGPFTPLIAATHGSRRGFGAGASRVSFAARVESPRVRSVRGRTRPTEVEQSFEQSIRDLLTDGMVMSEGSAESPRISSPSDAGILSPCTPSSPHTHLSATPRRPNAAPSHAAIPSEEHTPLSHSASGSMRTLRGSSERDSHFASLSISRLQHLPSLGRLPRGDSSFRVGLR